jgi:hypothetical protein
MPSAWRIRRRTHRLPFLNIAKKLGARVRDFLVALHRGPLDRRQGENQKYAGPERREGGHMLAAAGVDRPCFKPAARR